SCPRPVRCSNRCATSRATCSPPSPPTSTPSPPSPRPPPCWACTATPSPPGWRRRRSCWASSSPTPTSGSRCIWPAAACCSTAESCRRLLRSAGGGRSRRVRPLLLPQLGQHRQQVLGEPVRVLRHREVPAPAHLDEAPAEPLGRLPAGLRGGGVVVLAAEHHERAAR